MRHDHFVVTDQSACWDVRCRIRGTTVPRWADWSEDRLSPGPRLALFGDARPWSAIDSRPCRASASSPTRARASTSATRREPRKLGYLIGSHGTAEATQSLDDLYRVCEEFKKERIDILGISGGDGTMHHTLTAMIKTYGEQPLPLVAILRGGTMNTIANSLGIRGETPQLLFELVDKHRRGSPSTCSRTEILQVGDKYGFIFGNGIIYNFLHEYYATGNPSPATAAKLISRAAASAMVRRAAGAADLPALSRPRGRRRRRLGLRGLHHRRRGGGASRSASASRRSTAATSSRTGSRCSASTPTRSASSPSCRASWRASRMRRDKVIDAVATEVRLRAARHEKLEYIIDGDTYVRRAGR